MNLYFSLSKIPFLKSSYSNKFLFVAFLGIHIPLIGLIFLIVFSNQHYSDLTIILITLLLTLIATFITLIVIHKLIKPISLASKTLIDYRTNRVVPELPMQYKDESGLLMSNIQHTINENEIYLKQKQDLINLLTHDIRNFASQPIGLADLILEEQEDENTTSTYAKLIRESATKQLLFLESFITLLHEEDEIAKAEVKKRTVNIKSVMDAVSQELSSTLSKKKIDLVIQCDILEVVLYNKELLLTRIISNLAHNAIKFSNAGDTIEINVLRIAGFIQINVKDEGIGFDISKKQYLFTKFSGMGRLGTSQEVSTGIGLYLCSEMVKKFKGSIDAFSEGENTGATFTVLLPEHN